jgi:AraC family transcriptional regulator
MLADLKMTLPTTHGTAIYPPGATFGPRPMRDFEFVWIIEGDAEYRYDNIVVSAPAGAIVLCRPGYTDFFRWDETQRTRHAFFHFQINKIPKTWPPIEKWPIVRQPTEGDILRPLFRYLLTWTGKGNEDQLKLSMAHMLSSFISGEISTADVPPDALPEPVERAWSFIQSTLEEEPAADISLDDLSSAAFVSSEHLCRLFKSALGRSPIETVRLARLDAAAVLLARSNYSIKQIAELHGFATPFHFSRTFKDAFGQSPRQMRQAVQNGAVPPVSRLLRRNHDRRK